MTDSSTRLPGHAQHYMVKQSAVYHCSSSWNLNPFEFQGFVIKFMDWKPAPTIMGLGQIQDQKVHISTAGLVVAKNVMRTAILARSLLFQLEIWWQQLICFFVLFCFVLMWNTNLILCSPKGSYIYNGFFHQKFYEIWLSGEVFPNWTCAVVSIQARVFHALRMKLSDRFHCSSSDTLQLQQLCRMPVGTSVSGTFSSRRWMLKAVVTKHCHF